MQRPKGTKDLYGQSEHLKSYLTSLFREIAQIYNFAEIETPIFEHQNVFVRSIGESSDIVTKEMYSFQDKAKRDLVLRPEGTAGVMRAVVENKLYKDGLPLKLFYNGPMFRYENPQKGRQRQFHQLGVELLSHKSPYLDVEVILLASSFLKALKIPYKLKINYLADQETMSKWAEALKVYLTNYFEQLSPISQKRLAQNPLRILDDKEDGQKDFVKKAPPLANFYSAEAKKYFAQVQKFLMQIGIEFEVDPNLVRGLDYYNDTVFEFVPLKNNQGSQDTLIGGGRYDNLVSEFGGPKLSGVGFALGIERLINELTHNSSLSFLTKEPLVYVLNLSEQGTKLALGLVFMLRQAGIKTAWNYKPLNLIKAFAKAEKNQALIHIIAGEQEASKGKVKIKYQNTQQEVAIEKLVQVVSKIIEEQNEKN